jgi:hypothetical protein
MPDIAMSDEPARLRLGRRPPMWRGPHSPARCLMLVGYARVSTAEQISVGFSHGLYVDR